MERRSEEHEQEVDRQFEEAEAEERKLERKADEVGQDIDDAREGLEKLEDDTGADHSKG